MVPEPRTACMQGFRSCPPEVAPPGLRILFDELLSEDVSMYKVYVGEF